MQETGTMGKLWQKIERQLKRNNDGSKVQEANVLGFDDVALPFVTLLVGVCAGILLLGIEGVAFCMEKYAVNENKCDDGDTSEEISKIKDEINEMLLELNNQRWFHEWCMKTLRARKIRATNDHMETSHMFEVKKPTLPVSQ